MKWLLLVIPAAVGVAIVFRRKAAHGFEIERMIERMPQGSPPKWMFENISTIRANTERIIELLDTERT